MEVGRQRALVLAEKNIHYPRTGMGLSCVAFWTVTILKEKEIWFGTAIGQFFTVQNIVKWYLKYEARWQVDHVRDCNDKE
jgi:hypothetical protein